MNRGDRDIKAHSSQSNRSMWVLFLSAIIAVIFIIAFIRPSLIGYSIYQDVQKTNYSIDEYGQSVHNLKTELIIAQANKTVYTNLANRLEEDLGEKETQLSTCQSERTTLQANLKSSTENANIKIDLLQTTIKDKDEAIADLKRDNTALQTKANDDLSKQQAELQQECLEDNSILAKNLATLQASYDAFVVNQAKSVCCKERVDNPEIQYYDTLNNKLICLEEGTKSLVC